MGGYIHTAEDLNDHADFISFMEKIQRAGNSGKEVYIVSQEGETSVLNKTKFGYKYEVLR